MVQLLRDRLAKCSPLQNVPKVEKENKDQYILYITKHVKALRAVGKDGNSNTLANSNSTPVVKQRKQSNVYKLLSLGSDILFSEVEGTDYSEHGHEQLGPAFNLHPMHPHFNANPFTPYGMTPHPTNNFCFPQHPTAPHTGFGSQRFSGNANMRRSPTP
ncbi:hypothetical protein HDU76_009101 [Blyttiomyces sp. JEL0837]|nr:hypothetical protein HDU76_009101 [Blyttiomyces sp. JEL0837]